ncbi:hypothetical protein M427DRAFT_29593 [Gonapodya prolifera JEL478]|uniref:Alpha/beta-hydrolase n=1 Tax=Gonapodya prolifera (strain JEL478) TaxID=1344416 RepID=A0A139APM3_GONPJ|nr:hypothetical protein M427DRAFT_29593 [Gonapodya prolifera JEL478]|eukprot:KXS18699.1 hypothetical protein M427DRAFT_29593 [Gonapodya prolifera JEL478]
MSYTLEKAKDDEFLISWDFGEELARHIRPQASAIPFPPIIVAQGTAGNVALSYLESHPSAALVLISPGLAFGGAWCPGLSSGKYDDRLWRTKDNVYNIVGQENMPCNDFDSRSGDYFPVGPLLNPAMDPSLSLTSIRIESSRKSKFPMIVLDFVPMTTVSRLAADQLAESVRISEEEYAGKILECEYVAISIDTPVERFEMMRAGAWALDEEVSGVVCDVVDEWLDEHSL